MNCDAVTKLIPLYFYGEVTPDEEDQIDQHLDECAACAARMEQQRALAASLDRRQMDFPPALLDECREDLMAAIAGGAPHRSAPAKGPWTLFLEAMAATFAGMGRLRQPAAALLLIFVGYAAARFTGMGTPATAPLSAENAYPTVRSIKTDNDGTVRIQFDETRRREIAGRIEDPNIQHLILTASVDKDPSVREESVSLLKNRADSQEVMDSLLNVLTTDPNDGVRLKALDALKPVAADPRVVKALSQVLLSDANPAVRYQAIDLMVTHRDDAVVGALQSLMQREDNSAVRVKASKVLKDWNASIGTF